MNFPAEILLEVFQHCLEDIDTYSYYIILNDLRLVSSRWTSLIEETSSFWTQITSWDPISSKAFTRSSASLLDIDINGLRPQKASVITQVIFSGNRWRSLKLAYKWDAVAEAILATPAPNLSILSLSGHFVITSQIFSGLTRCLTHLELERCEIPWDSHIFRGLRSFRFAKGHIVLRMQDLLTGLGQASELEQLRLENVVFHGTTSVARPDGTTFPFPKLKLMTTRTMGSFDWCDFMDNIWIPTTMKLDVTFADAVYEGVKLAVTKVKERAGLLDVQSGARPVSTLR